MTKTEEGTVVGLIAGFYDVELTSGQRVRTRARGVFRQKSKNLLLEIMLKFKLMKRGLVI